MDRTRTDEFEPLSWTEFSFNYKAPGPPVETVLAALRQGYHRMPTDSLLPGFVMSDNNSNMQPASVGLLLRSDTKTTFISPRSIQS